MVKSPAYPPLDSLFDLACRDGVDIRPTLLRVLTDLYVQKPVHSAAEEIQYVELALGLVDTVDAQTRTIVAARLKTYRGAPAAVLARLEDHGGVAGAADGTAGVAPRQDLTALFFNAGVEERRLILTNLDVAADPQADRLAPASPETIRRLENAALARNTAEFTRLLEGALGVPRDIAARVVRDLSGEPIVIAARALGMKADVLQRVLLFLNPVIGQSVQRVYDLARLYDEITPHAAARMALIWRGTRARTRPPHAPVHWDDEQQNTRSLALPAPRRAVRSREARATKVQSNGR